MEATTDNAVSSLCAEFNTNYDIAVVGDSPAAGEDVVMERFSWDAVDAGGNQIALVDRRTKLVVVARKMGQSASTAVNILEKQVQNMAGFDDRDYILFCR